MEERRAELVSLLFVSFFVCYVHSLYDDLNHYIITVT
jgi:hypothetical protein